MSNHPLPENDEAITIYKYQVPSGEHWVFETDYRGPGVSFPDNEKPWISLLSNGQMWIRGGYSWNGATMFPDFKWIKIPSLPHDAGYQLIQVGAVDRKYRGAFDSTLRKHCKRKGSGFLWGFLVWLGVRVFGGAVVS